MSEIANILSPFSPLKPRPILKFESISPRRNTNHLRHRFRAEPHPTGRDVQPQGCMSVIETHRKQEPPSNNNKSYLIQGSPIRGPHDDSSTSRFSDSDKFSFSSRHGSVISKDSNKLPGIRQKINLEKIHYKYQDSVDNSCLLNDRDLDDTVYKRIDPVQSKENKRYIIKTSRNSSMCHAGQGSEVISSCSVEKKPSPEIRPIPKVKPIPVEKKEAVKAFGVSDEVVQPKEEKAEANNKNQESYKTLTSAYNSNKELNVEFDEGEDTEKMIKQVVEKHVEEAHKKIRMIKRKFHKRSKTFFFHSEKDN